MLLASGGRLPWFATAASPVRAENAVRDRAACQHPSVPQPWTIGQGPRWRRGLGLGRCGQFPEATAGQAAYHVCSG